MDLCFSLEILERDYDMTSPEGRDGLYAAKLRESLQSLMKR